MATIPILPVDDLESAKRFYAETLDFSIAWTWGDPPSLACVRRKNIDLFLALNPDLAARVDGLEI